MALLGPELKAARKPLRKPQVLLIQKKFPLGVRYANKGNGGKCLILIGWKGLVLIGQKSLVLIG